MEACLRESNNAVPTREIIASLAEKFRYMIMQLALKTLSTTMLIELSYCHFGNCIMLLSLVEVHLWNEQER